MISFNLESGSGSITDTRCGSTTIYQIGDYIQCYSIDEKDVNESTPTFTIKEIHHYCNSKELWMVLVNHEDNGKRTIACAKYYFRHVKKQEASVIATVDGESDYENKAFKNAVDKFNREYGLFVELYKSTGISPCNMLHVNKFLNLFNLYSMNKQNDKGNVQSYRCKMEHLVELLVEERRKFSEKREKELLDELER